MASNLLGTTDKPGYIGCRHLAGDVHTNKICGRLLWTKGVFQARIYDRLVWPWQYRDVEVQGKISGRFGIYQGDDRGQETRNNHVHSLVHLPTRRIIATLSHHRSCRAFAGELVYLWINWDQDDPETLVQGQPDQPKMKEIVARWKRRDP